jgi:hypothetical protein
MENTISLDKDITDVSDLSNQVINMENPETNIQLNSGNISPISPSLLPQLESQLISQDKKGEVANNLIESVGNSFTKTWLDKFLCCLTFLKQYFNITSTELRKRLISSLIPFNSEFFNISKNSPDLYGPFWIYTTLIFLISASGSIFAYKNPYKTNIFQQYVPIAGTIVYSIGFGLPLVAYICFKVIGEKISYITCVCIYGYSLSVFIPVLVVCSLGIQVLVWLLLLYGAGASTMFIIVNYWKGLGGQVGNKKFVLIGFVVFVQVLLFMLLKFYFFGGSQQDKKE